MSTARPPARTRSLARTGETRTSLSLLAPSVRFVAQKPSPRLLSKISRVRAAREQEVGRVEKSSYSITETSKEASSLNQTTFLLLSRRFLLDNISRSKHRKHRIPIAENRNALKPAKVARNKQRNVRAYINVQPFSRVISVGIPPAQLPRLVGALKCAQRVGVKILI